MTDQCCNDDIDVECPICGRLIYKYGIYADVGEPYRCTNGHKFTTVEYNKLWLEVFEGNDT